MPRKPLTAAEDKPALMPPSSRSLDEIIGERTAGLPFETFERDPYWDVVRRTILEILQTQPTVPLTDHARHYVALELERLWLPKKERAKIERQRTLRGIETWLDIVKRAKKLAGPDIVKRAKKLAKKLARSQDLSIQGSAIEAIEAILPAIVKGPDGRTFQSSAALAQFLKRERAAKKKKPQR
jgi:hypothetical protein